MRFKFILLILLFVSTTVMAQEVGQSEVDSQTLNRSPRPRQKPKDLNSAQSLTSLESPKCFEESLELINSKNPEDVIKNLFKDLSDEEIQTRLIFAEALASGPNCIHSSEREGLFQGVAWVVSNRFKSNLKKFGVGRDSVFKKGHFRSSFGSCDVAQRKALLCPSSIGEDWNKSWQSAQDALKMTENEKLNPLKNVYNYFFGQHFDLSKDGCKKWKGVQPSWATKEAKRYPDVSGLKAESTCIEFYEVR